MNKMTLLAGAALLGMSGLAVAQTPPPSDPNAPAATPPADPGMTPPAAPADAAAPATTPPADASAPPPPADAASPAPAPAPADASAAAPPPAAPGADPAKTQQAQATVDAGWAKYDKGGKGSLTPLEFGEWIMAARGSDMTAQVDKTKASKAANLPAIKVLNATAGEFAKADSDKNRMISKDELTAYLAAS